MLYSLCDIGLTYQIEVLPKIESYKMYIEEAIKSKYYEDLKYLENMIN